MEIMSHGLCLSRIALEGVHIREKMSRQRSN